VVADEHREFGGLDNALHGHPRFRQRNVVTHGTAKQKILLQYYPDLPA
jgi:hypothetical protein